MNKKHYTVTIDPIQWCWQVMQHNVFLEQEISWYDNYTTDEDENVVIKFQVNMPEIPITVQDMMDYRIQSTIDNKEKNG